MLGGDDGSLINISEGDVIVIPAGVAHKNFGASEDFECVGAYPNGEDFDIKTADSNTRTADEENVKNVSLPETDPVFGRLGPVMEHWLKNGRDSNMHTNPQFD
jgi:uncharacterized protein YjlB